VIHLDFVEATELTLGDRDTKYMQNWLWKDFGLFTVRYQIQEKLVMEGA